MNIPESLYANAVALAEKMQGLTDPNPPVAAIALDASGTWLAEAVHEGVGKPHAEVILIEKLRNQNLLEKLHTMIVTLEPCNHHGRTPPCTQALLKTPVRSVLFACKDSNPGVRGGGQKTLQEAGIHCDLWSSDLTQQMAQGILKPFFKHARTGLPWVVVKEVLNIKGTMIPPTGKKTFSSEKSLILAHILRKKSGAILTGVNTVIQDLPEFTVRKVDDFPKAKLPHPRILVVMDREGRIPHLWLKDREKAGFEVWIEQELKVAVEKLGARGILQILVEGGPTLLNAIREQKLWDEWVQIQAQEAPQEDLVTTQLRLELG